MINPLAAELNQTIKNSAPVVYGMLSRFGKEVFFPKGILHQSALARKQKKINATVGIATEMERLSTWIAFINILIFLKQSSFTRMPQLLEE